MAITTDSYENIVYSGSTVTRIGLSKSLNNYSLDELYAHVYCSYSNRLYKLILERQNSNINTFADTDKVPYVVTTSGTKVTVNNGIGAISDARGDYQFIVWLKGSRPEAGTYSIYQYQLSDFKMVTEWDAPNYYYKLPNPVSTFGTCATAWDDDESTIKTTWSTVDGHGELFYRYVNGGAINDISLSSNSIYPYAMFKRGSRIYLKQLRQNAPVFMATVAKGSDYYTGGSWLYSVQPDDPGISVAGGNFVNPVYTQPDMTDTPTDPFTYYYDGTGLDRKIRYCKTSDNAVIGRISYNGSNPSQYLGIESYFTNKRQSLLFWAGCGVKFYADKLYKPIISDGFVTDFTDDMTTPSDLDNWSGKTKHNVPVAPPTPTPTGGDELTDMLSRGQFYGSGLTKYYVDVPAAKLQKALGDWDNIKTGKDVLQNLLSYKILCFPSTTFSNGMTEPFVIAGTELKDESNNTITAKKLTSTGAVNLPGITITPTFNDFRDYAPYTKIQMFVPLCGWFDLPPWCMGRRITGEMYINPYSGTVRCLVRADGNVVAELGGNASIDLPFNATAVGMKSAAVISNLIQTAGAVGRAAMLPTVNTLAGAGSAALGTICAMNANYTESKGTMGDGSNVYGLYHVFIKITRPATVDNEGNSLVTIPSQYCHDYGRPCNKQLTLTAGDGYTQVMDANIEGAMTDREKQMIIDGFRHGLIL